MWEPRLRFAGSLEQNVFSVASGKLGDAEILNWLDREKLTKERMVLRGDPAESPSAFITALELVVRNPTLERWRTQAWVASLGHRIHPLDTGRTAGSSDHRRWHARAEPAIS